MMRILKLATAITDLMETIVSQEYFVIHVSELLRNRKYTFYFLQLSRTPKPKNFNYKIV